MTLNLHSMKVPHEHTVGPPGHADQGSGNCPGTQFVPGRFKETVTPGGMESSIMRISRLFHSAGLAVVLLVCGGSGVPTPSGAGASPLIALSPPSVARMRLDDRIVQFSLAVSASDVGGETTATVWATTIDRRGLPPGLMLRRVTMTKGRESWSGPIYPYLTLQYDPTSRGGAASGGPPWPQGTRVNVRVEYSLGRNVLALNFRNVIVRGLNAADAGG